MLSFSLIVPTKDRPEDIRTLLANLSKQSVSPDQIIVVDSSSSPQVELPEEFSSLNIDYRIFDAEPSAAAQRNTGLAYVHPDIDLIGFVDDDIVFQPDAFEKMLRFWQMVPADVCGAAFNLQEEDAEKAVGKLKHSRFVRWLGLYDPKPGAVAPSGWHTRLGTVYQNTKVDWFSTSAAIWRRKVLLNHQFDEFFKGYSYLEDLDFSYSISRDCTLMIVADARFQHFHHHDEWSQERLFEFGVMEVRNRLYIVHKHGLSVGSCYMGLVVRMLQTVLSAIQDRDRRNLSRAKGNLVGMYRNVLGRW